MNTPKIQTININQQKIPIHTITTNTKTTQIIGVQGIIQIKKSKTDTRTLRTITTQHPNTITNIYNNMTKKANLNRTTQQYQQLCNQLIQKHTQQLQITPKKIRHTTMTLDKFGLAYKNNTITLNTLLQYMNQDIIENTIYHELCHLYTLKHHNTLKHDKNFYTILHKKYTPTQLQQILKN